MTNKLCVVFCLLVFFTPRIVCCVRVFASFLSNRRRHKNYGWTQEKAWKAQRIINQLREIEGGAKKFQTRKEVTKKKNINCGPAIRKTFEKHRFFILLLNPLIIHNSSWFLFKLFIWFDYISIYKIYLFQLVCNYNCVVHSI